MSLPIPQLNNLHSQQGFTLLELLVVVGILAVIAGSTIFANKTQTIDNAKVTAAITEMQNIRHALLQYKTDNFEFPKKSTTSDPTILVSPATLAFLLEQSDEKTWNNDYQTGWRGPYLSSGDSGLVDIGDNLKFDGSGKPYIIDSSAITLQRGIPDPFIFAPVTNGESKPLISSPCDDSADANNKCLLDWRIVGQTDADDPLQQKGRPYLAFDLDKRDKARIVSMGPNGIYDSGTVSNCSSDANTTDDLILCLY